MNVADLKKELMRLGEAPESFKGLQKGDLAARLGELQGEATTTVDAAAPADASVEASESVSSAEAEAEAASSSRKRSREQEPSAQAEASSTSASASPASASTASSSSESKSWERWEGQAVPRCIEALSDAAKGAILAEVAEGSAAVRSLILAKAGVDPAMRKLFVKNLNVVTTTEEMLAFYGQYGEVEEGTVCCDRVTKTSKMYGFLTFKTVEGAFTALQASPAVLAEKTLQVNLAADKDKVRASEQGGKPLCYANEKGACTRGDTCRFSHDGGMTVMNAGTVQHATARAGSGLAWGTLSAATAVAAPQGRHMPMARATAYAPQPAVGKVPCHRCGEMGHEGYHCVKGTRSTIKGVGAAGAQGGPAGAAQTATSWRSSLSRWASESPPRSGSVRSSARPSCRQPSRRRQRPWRDQLQSHTHGRIRDRARWRPPAH